MSEEEVKYCFYCGIKLNREAKYCAGCGTHLEEETSFEIKDAQSVQKPSQATQSETTESIQDEPSTVSTSNNNGLGLAVGAALLLGHSHRIHRRVQRHRRQMRRARVMRRRMMHHNRTMRRRF